MAILPDCSADLAQCYDAADHIAPYLHWYVHIYLFFLEDASALVVRLP